MFKLLFAGAIGLIAVVAMTMGKAALMVLILGALLCAVVAGYFVWLLISFNNEARPGFEPLYSDVTIFVFWLTLVVIFSAGAALLGLLAARRLRRN